MDKTQIVKYVTSTVASLAVGSAIQTAVTTHVPAKNPLHKIGIVIAAYVIGAMVAEGASEWTKAKVDEAIANFKKKVEES